jgi:hypothetical protein
MWSRALTLIDAGPAWLAGGGCAIAQIHPREHDKLSFQNLRQVDERKYGSTWLGFFERVDEPA